MKRTSLALVAAIVASFTAGYSTIGDAAAKTVSVAMMPTKTHVTVERFEPGGFVPVDLGIYFEARNGDLQLDVGHSNYQSPLTTTVTERQGNRTRRRTLPPGLQVDLGGLLAFATVTIRDADGNQLTDEPVGFCPNAPNAQRVSPAGPDQNRFPAACTFNPFAFHVMYGIAQGWAVPALPSDGSVWMPDLPIDDGEYTYTYTVDNGWAEFLRMPVRETSVQVTIVTLPAEDSQSRRAPSHGMEPSAVTAEGTGRAAPVQPRPRTLPDLRALPAFGISTYSDETSGLDLLGFWATTWNAGPAPMVIDGMNDRSGTGTMDAYQLLYDGDRLADTLRTGTMHYHEGGGHNHWHFGDFTQYDLTDEDQTTVQTSGKEAWCLAPTDAIDLTIIGALLRPEVTGLSSSCAFGNPDALWIREVLPAGWGDTYSQAVSGQAFDITAVPNGTYFIRVVANPDSRLYEKAYDNNASYRQIVLGGEAGARTVHVPPFDGIDSEGQNPALARSVTREATGYALV